VNLYSGYGTIDGSTGDDTIQGDESSEFYSGFRVSGGDGNDLVLVGGPDTVFGGAGNDMISGGTISGGLGADTFQFRGAYSPGYYYVAREAQTIVHDFQANDQVDLAGFWISGWKDATYYGRDAAIYTPVESADMILTRSGNDLVLSTPEHPDYYGEYVDASRMTLKDFFSSGLDTLVIEGVRTDVSDL
jgi:Ca2+-binding RTX toxin-like protein